MSLKKFSYPLEGGGYAIPVCHYQMEFALYVHQTIKEIKPDAIAVEYPPTLREIIIRGIKRLPYLSIVLYEDKKGNKIYIPIEPCDPFIEAVRLGIELNIPQYFVDLDLDDYPLYFEPMPDPYSIYRIGLTAYFDAYRITYKDRPKSIQDNQRETALAYNLQKLQKRYNRLLFVCGMFHLEGVAEKLKYPQVQPLGVVKRKNVRLYNLHEESSREIMGEFPYLSAIYEKSRNLSKKWENVILYPSAKKVPSPLKKEEDIQSKEEDIQSKEEVKKKKKAYLHLVSNANENNIEGRSSSGEEDIPFYPFPIDRQKVIYNLIKEAALKHRENSGEEVTPNQIRVLMKFSRNYAFIEGRLLADLYELLVSARGAVDDNFAYEVWDLGTRYPWQDKKNLLETLFIKGEEIWLKSRKIRLHRKFPLKRRRLVKLPIKKRKKEERPGQWREHFDKDILCSYPPEDIVVESFGRYLGKKAKMILSEELTRVIPFTASIMDGIDMRETIRNWHEEKKIYVRENRQIPGQVGSVVVIFDEDEKNERYPWLMTWLGEHFQESDMAFYATPEDKNMVGPGISRCEYGGFMLTYPPFRMFDIWTDPFYMDARSKSERLLMAALDYSLDKLVAYVSATPPRSVMHSLAARLGKKIIYIPIGQISPVTIKKIRVFHVLSGHDKRVIAKDYIW